MSRTPRLLRPQAPAAPADRRRGGQLRIAAAGHLLGGLRTAGRALRRPVTTGVIAVGVLAATAAGYAHPSLPAGAPGLTDAAYVSPLASATTSTLAVAVAAVPSGPSVAQTQAADYADKLAAANGRRADAAAEKARRVAAAKAAAKAAAVAKARKAAAERAARAKVRKAILANAQANPKAVAKLLLAQYGWSSQFGCLSALWTKESNWRYYADNPTSSAYGIPQALPGSKMSTFGSDWRTNPVTQIKWGLDYIHDRYGSPCSAWAHSQSHNWY